MNIYKVRNWIIALTIICLPSCIPKRLSEKDIIGLWVEDNKSPSYKVGVDCASIELYEDGRFKGHNLPEDYFVTLNFPIDITKRVDASGSWVLVSPTNDPFKNRVVNLRFDSNPESGDQLSGYSSAMMLTTLGEPMLYADIGDLSASIIFTQKKENWCKK